MVVSLPGELTVGNAAALRSLLLSALEAGEPVELDGRAVSEVDAAGLQVLWSAGVTARAKSLSLTFCRQGASRPLIEAIDLTGLGRLRDGQWLVEEANHG